MRKAVFAGAVALAMMGPLFVSAHGFGVTPASATEVMLTEGHIYRLKAALRLRGDQLAQWAPVEAALRAVLRQSGHAVQVSALQQVASIAGPLIASLDEGQKNAGLRVIHSLGVASAN